MCTALIAARIIGALLVWSPFFRQACLAAALLFSMLAFFLVNAASARTLTHGDIQRAGQHWCNWSITATCQRWKANRHKPSYWRECGPNDMRSGCRYRHMN
jgi:hypothetical protein